MKPLSRLAVAALALWIRVATGQEPVVVVVFNPVLDGGEVDAIVSAAGLARIEHPDLLPNQRIVRATTAEVERLRVHPNVTAVFPASQSLTTGVAVHGCQAAAMIRSSKGSGYQASIGSGWGRDASLTWSVSKYPETIPQESANTILERALGEWARHAAIHFTRTNQPRARRNVEFLFGSGEHGDGYPFPANHTLLAHAFYPAGVNPEPIAGDVHLNSDEAWGIGGDRDLYSAALHEIGHALGLTHSSRPGTVMYPYYRELSSLTIEDIDELQALYGPPADAEMLSVTIGGPAVTTAAFAELQGTVTGGRGEVAVTWSANGIAGRAAGGRSWTAAAIPLVAGSNEIQISAVDADGRMTARTWSVSRSEITVLTMPPTPPPPMPSTSGADHTAPTLTISSPASAIYSTSLASMRISGTARDNGEVTEVTWETGGSSGTAQGTSTWTAEVPLLVGDNVVVIRARDAAGNAGWRSLLVIRR